MSDQPKNILASTFDRLIESNLALTTSVADLVKLTWAVIGCNAVLVALTIYMLWRSQ